MNTYAPIFLSFLCAALYEAFTAKFDNSAAGIVSNRLSQMTERPSCCAHPTACDSHTLLAVNF